MQKDEKAETVEALASLAQTAPVVCGGGLNASPKQSGASSSLQEQEDKSPKAAVPNCNTTKATVPNCNTTKAAVAYTITYQATVPYHFGSIPPPISITTYRSLRIHPIFQVTILDSRRS